MKAIFLLQGLLALLGFAAVANAQVDVKPFIRQDAITRLKISPNGDYYAMAVPMEDRTSLTIWNRKAGKVSANIMGDRNSVIDDFWWVNDERVVLSLAEQFGSEDEPKPTGELSALNADGSGSVRLFKRYGPNGDARVPQAAFMVDTLADDDRHVLVSVMSLNKNPQTHVEKIDVYTRKRSVVATAPVRNARFATDAVGRVRFSQGADIDNVSRLYYRSDDGAEWKLINDEAQSGHVVWPLGFARDDSKAYLQSETSDGPDAIVEMDLASGARRELMRDAVVDPYAVIRDGGDRTPVGAFFMDGGLRTGFFDPASTAAGLYRMLQGSFPGQAVHVTSATTDGRLLVVRAWSDRRPGAYFLVDTATSKAEIIFNQRSWLNPDVMASTRAVSLKARDGLALHGYLTLPPGAGEKNLPLVVVPHGGPFSIFDQWGFDDEAQLLSKAGYAVLKVNFRGSGN